MGTTNPRPLQERPLQQRALQERPLQERKRATAACTLHSPLLPCACALAYLEAALLALVDGDAEVTRGVAGAVEPVDAEIAQHVLVAVRADSSFGPPPHETQEKRWEANSA